MPPHLHGLTGLSAASQHTCEQASQLCCILRGGLAHLGHCLEALGGQLGNGLGCHVGQHHQAGLIPPAPLQFRKGLSIKGATASYEAHRCTMLQASPNLILTKKSPYNVGFCCSRQKYHHECGVQVQPQQETFKPQGTHPSGKE